MNKRRAFIIGIKSTTLNLSEIEFIKKYKPWGIILFSRNIKSINQTKKLTNKIRKIFKDKNYPILIDQEGGKINRLKNLLSFETLTSYYFGNLFLKDKKKFYISYELFIKTTSFLLKSIGVNINTVPVLDLRYKNTSNVIGDRSFSKDTKIVSKLGNYCIKSFHQNKIGTVMKHIPGHGLAKVDSHYFTPTIKKDFSHLMNKDFSTFKNKDCFFAMTAHVIFSKIDNQNTATHSKKIIKLIRNKIGFKNILISDDLSMKSLKGSLKENTIRMFNAGCNIALHCNGKYNEMEIVAKNSPIVDEFITKKTSQFYKILR